MNLETLGPNVTILNFDHCSILYSYSTPVAVHIPNRGWYVTEERFSVTTSRHINRYASDPVAKVAQRLIQAVANNPSNAAILRLLQGESDVEA